MVCFWLASTYLAEIFHFVHKFIVLVFQLKELDTKLSVLNFHLIVAICRTEFMHHHHRIQSNHCCHNNHCYALTIILIITAITVYSLI